MCEKFVRRETGKRKKVSETDQTSLLINEEKHIGEIKYKALLAEKNIFSNRSKQNKTSKKASRTTRSLVRWTFVPI